MLRSSGVGAHQQLAPVRQVPQCVPHLLAGDHEAVAVGHRPRLQRRQIGTGVGLGEALAPDLVPAEHGPQEPLLLLLGPVLHDRRRDVRDADGVERAGRVRPAHLLGQDHLFHHPRPAAAVLLGPGDGRVPRVS